jgi:hypothetical protein
MNMPLRRGALLCFIVALTTLGGSPSPATAVLKADGQEKFVFRHSGCRVLLRLLAIQGIDGWVRARVDIDGGPGAKTLIWTEFGKGRRIINVSKALRQTEIGEDGVWRIRGQVRIPGKDRAADTYITAKECPEGMPGLGPS